MIPRSHYVRCARSGVTILEVLASAMLIFIGLAAIFGMNGQSLQVLRKTRQAAAATQILQERIETMRMKPWPEVSRGRAVASWWATPAQSAPDLADATPTETITVSIAAPPDGTEPPPDSFEVERRAGVVTVLREADFAAERLLLVDVRIQWREQRRTQERRLRTIIGRNGLTRSGIFGSAFGRAAYTPPTP